MRRTIRASTEQWTIMALCLVLSLAVLATLPFIRVTDRLSMPLFVLITVIGNGWIVLDTVISRATLDAHAIEFRSPLRRRRLRTTLGAIGRYHPEKDGGWVVETEGRTVPVPMQSPWDLHAAMVEFAPTRLGAKRLRPLHLPPTEEFVGLWTLDTDLLVSETILKIVLCLIVVGLLRGQGGVGATGPLIGLLVLTFFRSWTRVDVTNEGIVRRGPLGRRTIGWSEATAIFCERPGGRRSFVVTAPGRGIEVPPHLAKDLDLMRKVFRSLPEGTLCVNFDESTFRGYRRRKENRKAAPKEDLLPALTANSAPSDPKAKRRPRHA